MIKVLFVCLGNICRSPMAEAVFRKLVKEKGLEDKISCNSSGTSNYHIGDPPDSRALNNALINGLVMEHKAQQFMEENFDQYDYIIAMDKSNLSIIKRLNGDNRHKSIFLMRQFEEDDKSVTDVDDVPDPYFGGESGFQEVYEILYRCNSNFLNYLIKKHDLT